MSDVMTSAVDTFLAGVEAGMLADGIFADDATLDATVPNWRFSVRGGVAVRATLGEWFADPGRFEDLTRVPTPDGELVEFTLTWQEHGVLHMCHQAHILRLRDGRVASDTAFCGGRWPARLIEQMQTAHAASAARGEG